MRKMIVQLGFFFLFTGMIWGLGENPHKDDELIKYLVFASQLLYGNLCYDVLKSLRTVPSGDRFWSTATNIAGEAAALIIIALGLLVLAFKVPFFAYLGLAGALIAYACVFYRVLPKLQPAYVQALNTSGTPKF
jgi:hypothetical protein